MAVRAKQPLPAARGFAKPLRGSRQQPFSGGRFPQLGEAVSERQIDEPRIVALLTPGPSLAVEVPQPLPIDGGSGPVAGITVTQERRQVAVAAQAVIEQLLQQPVAGTSQRQCIAAVK